MSGIRIYELARELGVANKVLIEMLGKMGYFAKSHSSSIELHLADRLRRQVKKKGLGSPPKKKPSRPAVKKTAPATAKHVKPPTKKPAEQPAGSKPKPAIKKAVPAKTTPAVQKPVPAKATPAVQKPVPAKATPVVKKAPEAVRPAIVKPVRPRPVVKKALSPAEMALLREKEKKRRLEEKARREEVEARRRAEKETKRKEREEKRRAEAEEREIQRLIDEEEKAKRAVEAMKIVIDETTTVKEFADKLRLGVNEIISLLIGKGIMATVNQTIDAEVARELATELGFEIKTREEEELEEETEEAEDKAALEPRPPVITIMGHVDHGKTSLLDTIRKTTVTEHEAGGITQRVGAYKVELDKGTIVFLDTPGHEAFTAMRARGASVTDIVVLVVAADDGVMPQTLEAIHHAKAAGANTLVAINKIDKPGANVERIRQELSANGLTSEEWGGETIYCEVSAKQNIGIDNMLDMILLQAEMMELKANPARAAVGVIIESKLDKGRGAVATVLVQKGTLKVGDVFVSGTHHGKVRAIFDDQGKRCGSAGPSIPVEVLGFSGVPSAGETFSVVESERKAHQIALKRQEAQRTEGLSRSRIKLETLHAQITKGDIKDLNIIIKADTQGSIEAVRKALDDIHVGAVRIMVLHGAVGGITETDINLATASNAIVIGFNVRPTEKAAALAVDEGVDIRLYSVIYSAIDDIKSALEGMLEPVYKEVITGRAEVRETFHITKVGTIAGCMVTSGKMVRNAVARLIRDAVVIHTGSINSLKRFKDDAREVASGYECGAGFEKYNDLKVGDVIETFEMEEIKRQS